MPSRYTVRFVTHAEEQRQALPPAGRQALELKVRELEEDPFRDAEHKAADDSWTSTFGEWGVILYVVGERIVTVTVLRVTWVGD
jgi:mRNA-degrading endonuclease RelE of RelBE toxin-antitoxin system